jgi:hypothetical protein
MRANVTFGWTPCTVLGTAVPRGCRWASQPIAPPRTIRSTRPGPCVERARPVLAEGQPGRKVAAGRNGIATRVLPATAEISVTLSVGERSSSTARNALPLTTACVVVPSLWVSSTRSTPSATIPNVTDSFGIVNSNGPLLTLSPAPM